MSLQNTGIVVSRRYKHFDWLFGRFVEKFTCISIPPLPDKQITGELQEQQIVLKDQLFSLTLNSLLWEMVPTFFVKQLLWAQRLHIIYHLKVIACAML